MLYLVIVPPQSVLAALVDGHHAFALIMEEVHRVALVVPGQSAMRAVNVIAKKVVLMTARSGFGVYLLGLHEFLLLNA